MPGDGAVLPHWVLSSCPPWELGGGSEEGLALGPPASAMWLRGCQMDIPGPGHPSAQNRCRHHLASGKGPLACGCVYGAASDPLMDMLTLDGSEATCSYAGWPWVWGTPELAPHV